MVVPPAADAPLRQWEQARHGVAWWRSDIASRPLPDNYTILDRNIAGPRAWYGRFNYAATLREIPEAEPGHATLMGAQVTRENFEAGVLLMGVYPRVHLGGDRANPRSFAWLTSGLKSSLTVGREWSAFSANYQLHVFGSSTKGKVAPWRARQLWLGLPDRIVGVLEIFPESAQTSAASLETLVRLGVGGTVIGPPQTLVATGPGRYRYGDLQVIIHETGFAKTITEQTPFRVPKAPFSDIVLRDSDLTTGSRRCVIEIRPTSVTANAQVQVAATTTGLVGFRTKLSGKVFTLWTNPSTAPLAVPPATPSDRLSMHPSSAKSVIAPGEQVLQVESPAPTDHLPAWADFSALAAQTTP
ncbi:MAG: hypothetical protein H7Y06_03135 [Opitutaceae bacterium]|nr:hypothetical protein [Opitutaceae bacterium]